MPLEWLVPIRIIYHYHYLVIVLKDQVQVQGKVLDLVRYVH